MTPKIVGILNVTPDSFSDGGQFIDPKKALAHAQQLIKEGADIIDIGAESTRPGATPLDAQEEWERLAPVIAGLEEIKTPYIRFSIDTRHAKTAEKALAAGVDMINDVSGFNSAEMINAVAKSKCQLVVMHSLGVPADPKEVMDESLDVVTELLSWAGEKMQSLVNAGIKPERLIFDPGIGFGKNTLQSLAIIHRIGEFRELGVPLYVGHSRKSCLTAISENSALSRDEATIAISQHLVQQGVNFLRVHDVTAHRDLFIELRKSKK
jgi:dihydropteroate synthase